jgi:hypothetical protein
VPPRPLAEVLTGAAKAEYEAGRILFQDGDHANAIIKFERSYELSRDPRLLWNAAFCYKNLKRYARMLAMLEKYLRDGGPLLTPQDRQEATALIETISAFVSRLDLHVSEEGAAVFVDEQQVGVTPLRDPVRLDVGPRKIRIFKPGFKELVVVREVVGGGEIALAAVLEKEVHRGRLIVAAGAQDFIFIDSRMVGRGSWEGWLPSGGHTLRVTAPGMLAHQTEVILQDNQVRRLDVRLKADPPDNLARWLWIGGGAVLLAGTVVAGALVFSPEPPVPGNVSPGTIQVAGHSAGFPVRFGGAW